MIRSLRATFVVCVEFGMLEIAGHHQRDACASVDQVRGVAALDTSQGLEGRAILNDDQIPRLDVPSATGPARHLQDVLQRFRRHGFGRELANLPQAAQEGNFVGVTQGLLQRHD